MQLTYTRFPEVRWVLEQRNLLGYRSGRPPRKLGTCGGARGYSSITAEGNVGTVDAILAQDSLDFFGSEMSQGHGICHVDSTFVLLLESDVWRLLV
jgi:hypothetical protein